MKNRRSKKNKLTPISRQRGISLPELLVAGLMGTTISAMSISLLGNLYINSQSQFVRSEHEANARSIERFLDYHIQKAGYHSKYDEGIGSESFATETVFSATFEDTQVIEGSDGTSFDTITYRYRGHQSGAILDCAGRRVDENTILTEQIYVSNGDLFCQIGTATVETVHIASNIISFHAQYGVSDTPINQVLHYNKATDIAAAEWDNIVAVRLMFVLESEDNFYTAKSAFSYNPFQEGEVTLDGSRKYFSKNYTAINLENIMK